VYNPRLWLFALSFGASFVWLTIMGFECGCWPHGFMLWFGLAPVIFGLLLAVRLVAFKCYLVLDEWGIPTSGSSALARGVAGSSFHKRRSW
jgi:hypothetical protein